VFKLVDGAHLEVSLDFDVARYFSLSEVWILHFVEVVTVDGTHVELCLAVHFFCLLIYGTKRRLLVRIESLVEN